MMMLTLLVTFRTRKVVMATLTHRKAIPRMPDRSVDYTLLTRATLTKMMVSASTFAIGAKTPGTKVVRTVLFVMHRKSTTISRIKIR